MEGRRYTADINAGNKGFDLLNEPLEAYNRSHAEKFEPRKVFLLGNHENRITRAAEDDAQLEGLVSLDHLNVSSWGWEVHDFLEPVTIDGVVLRPLLVSTRCRADRIAARTCCCG
jgi:hypothetical protein